MQSEFYRFGHLTDFDFSEICSSTQFRRSLGSCNINKKAFNQLDELNLFVERNEENKQFEIDLLNSLRKNKAICEKASLKDIKYNKLRAFIEGFLM